MIKKLKILEIASALTEDFSRPAALALARYLDENFEEGHEFCAVETRCTWSEYKSAVVWCEEYHGDAWRDELEIDEELDEEELEELALAHVSKKTSIIEFDGGIIAQCY